MAGAEKLKAAARRARITQRRGETSSQNDPASRSICIDYIYRSVRFLAARDALVALHHCFSPLFHPILDPRGDKRFKG